MASADTNVAQIGMITIDSKVSEITDVTLTANIDTRHWHDKQN